MAQPRKFLLSAKINDGESHMPTAQIGVAPSHPDLACIVTLLENGIHAYCSSVPSRYAAVGVGRYRLSGMMPSNVCLSVLYL